MQSYFYPITRTNFSFEDDNINVVFKKVGNFRTTSALKSSCSIIVTVKDEASVINSFYDNLVDFIEKYNISEPKSNLPYIREIIFVDGGSQDNTVKLIERKVGKSQSFSVIIAMQPLGTKLAYAEYLGATIATGDYIIKIDGDGQHNVSIAYELLKHSSKFDVVIASRYIGSGGSRWSPMRGIISRIARAEFHVVFPHLRNVKDPLSGFFLCKRSILPNKPPHKDGFKYLMHILAITSKIKVHEIPYIIEERKLGESKILSSGHKMILNYNKELINCIKIRLNTAGKI